MVAQREPLADIVDYVCMFRGFAMDQRKRLLWALGWTVGIPLSIALTCACVHFANKRAEERDGRPRHEKSEAPEPAYPMSEEYEAMESNLTILGLGAVVAYFGVLAFLIAGLLDGVWDESRRKSRPWHTAGMLLLTLEKRRSPSTESRRRDG